MATTYNGLEFKTALEARWAAFFDLAGWQWWANPASIGDWKPDFKVTFPCNHSECHGSHTLLASVLPVTSIKAFENHPSQSDAHLWGVKDNSGKHVADGAAVFGIDPSITEWEIVHGSGAGVESVYVRLPADANRFWKEAGALITSK